MLYDLFFFLAIFTGTTLGPKIIASFQIVQNKVKRYEVWHLKAFLPCDLVLANSTEFSSIDSIHKPLT
jgi:hypothetical protein